MSKFFISMLFIFGLLYFACGSASTNNSQKETSTIENDTLKERAASRSVLMIIASKDFKDIEFQETYDALTKAGVKVTIASSTLNEVKGMDGKKVKPQVTLDQVHGKDFNIVIFIGGVGAKEYFNNARAQEIAIEAVNSKRYIAAICIAPVILANCGLLNGVKSTCFPSEAETIKKKKANYTGNKVEFDRWVITANGPDAAKEFAQTILKLLVS